MGCVNVRVESRRLAPHASWDEKWREFTSLLQRFKRVCHDANLAHIMKEKEFFVRACDKRRQKEQKKQLEIRRANGQLPTPVKAPGDRKQKTDR